MAKDRIRELRMQSGLAVQAGAAAAIAWFASHNLLGNEQPVFAPIVAVGTLASSAGKRLRSVVELVIGVALGIAIGDLLIEVIGTGAWQLGLVVVLAVVITVTLGGSGAVVTQAAATGVLIVTLTPQVSNIEAPRVVDALIGGFSALAVGTLLLPLNPMRLVTRVVDPLMDEVALELTEAGKALRSGDIGRVQRALERVRELQEELSELHDAIDAGRETASLSPLRWRRRAALKRYVDSAQYLHRVTHNSGTLIRRTITMLEDREPVPVALPDAIRLLAEAIRVLHGELSAGLEPQASRVWTRRACTEAGRSYQEGVGLSGSVVVAQIRTIASDLARASGLDAGDEANRLVREAVATGRADEKAHPHTGGGRERPERAPRPDRASAGDAKRSARPRDRGFRRIGRRR